MTVLRRILAQRKAWLAVVCIVSLAAIIWVADYVILPVFAPYPRVPIPASCTRNTSQLPAERNYSIPGAGLGTLLTRNADAAVVVTATYGYSPFSSTAYLINTSSNHIIQQLTFSDDIVAAGIDAGILYLFNDKLLYPIYTTSGAAVHYIVKADNYRGLITEGNARYLQTSFEMSALRPDGPNVSHLRLHFAIIAFGCYFP